MDAIYARQSVDKKDSISIETQIELCTKEVQPGGQYRVYKDKGFSGSNTNRPEFQRMLNDIRAGMITKVIVYRLDRMSRSLLDFANLIDFFDSNGVSFMSTQEKFDTGSPMGRAMLSITMVFAQLERETIQIRIKDNYYSRGEKGMFLGGPPAYGFDKVQTVIDGAKLKYLVPNEETAPVVRMMYSMYGDQRKTLGEISKYLNESKTPTAKGGTWNSSRVGMILRNPIYVKADVSVYSYYKDKGCNITSSPELFAGTNGCYLYGKRSRSQRKYTSFSEHVLSLAPSDGLVSADLFMKAQIRLDQNKQIDNSNWGTKTWLTGLAKCPTCGRALVPKNCGKGYNYFFCSGKYERACSRDSNFGRVNDIEDAVYGRISDIAKGFSSVKVAIQKKDNHDTNLLNAKIAAIDEQISKLIDLSLESGETSARYINAKIEKLDEEKKTIMSQIDQLAVKKQDDVSDEDITLLLKEWGNMDNRQKGALASLFLSKVIVTPETNSVELHWKHDFSGAYANPR